MRDILLTVILVGLLPLSLKRPFIGALMFALISLANPHRLTWGFAYSMPWAMLYAIITILGTLATTERIVGDSIKRYFPILLYVAWMGVTTKFAMDYASALPRWIAVIKVHAMCLLTLMLLTDWHRIKQLVWVCVASIAFFGLKGGVFTLLTGGEFLVWGPSETAIADNNHLAVGLVMTLPLMYWLFMETRRRWLQVLIAFSGLMSAVSIFGSHSRSAFLGIAAMATFLLLKSRHKFTVGLLILLVAGTIVPLMPQQYWQRMETIRTYQEDESAMSRITVWHMATNVANDRLTGAGFDYYSPRASQMYSPDPAAVHSSHSIYFQSLGEHGWPGLVIFLAIWVYVWSRCHRIIRMVGASDEGVAQASLARMVQVSLIGFAVGGAFVNIGNWDMTYYIAVAALATYRIVERQARQRDSARAGMRPRASRFNHVVQAR